MANIRKSSPSFVEEVRNELQGTLPSGNNSSIGTDFAGWNQFKKILDEGVSAGSVFSNQIISTSTLPVSVAAAYNGGVLAPNGDIHFIPNSAPVGQKISAAGVVSTYSLVYTTNISAYFGGTINPNGEIHFAPGNASVGQKIDINGTVSTYSLLYTSGSGAHTGAVLAPNGDIHFMRNTGSSARGQKVDINGVVSTYPLVFTAASGGCFGGILTPDGKIYHLPIGAAAGTTIQYFENIYGLNFSRAICLHPYLNKY